MPSNPSDDEKDQPGTLEGVRAVPVAAKPEPVRLQPHHRLQRGRRTFSGNWGTGAPAAASPAFQRDTAATAGRWIRRFTATSSVNGAAGRAAATADHAAALRR